MISTFYRSTIGKKVIVALTGLILFGFVVGHLLGNLLVFMGPEKLNAYGRYLHESLGILWGTRVILLVAVVLHIVNTIQLAALNRKSRPVPYVEHKKIAASYASLTMLWGGLLLIFYIVYHLLHFTFGSAHPNFQPGDVYANVVAGFSVWYVSAFYVVAMVALGFHLYHGLWSVFQTLGLNHPKYNLWRRSFATAVALAIAFGYIAIPMAVLLGLVK